MNHLDRNSQRLEAEFISASNEFQKTPNSLSQDNLRRLSQLMTIWACAYLEATCKEVLRAYAKKHANPQVQKYIITGLNRFRNPKMETILQLVGSFDKTFRLQLEDFSSGRIKNSIDSIVAQRNCIAHGEPTYPNIEVICEQFDDARRLSEKLESLFE